MILSSPLCRFMFMLCTALAALTGNAAGSGQPDTPEVQAAMLDGSPYSLAGNRGAVTLLALWSPQSLASRKSIAELDRFAAAYRSRGVNTIAIATTSDAQALRAFVSGRGLSVPVAMLGEHNLGKLPEHRLPVIYAFDRGGHVHARHDGLYSFRILERMVAPLLDKQETTR